MNSIEYLPFYADTTTTTIGDYLMMPVIGVIQIVEVFGRSFKWKMPHDTLGGGSSDFGNVTHIDVTPMYLRLLGFKHCRDLFGPKGYVNKYWSHVESENRIHYNHFTKAFEADPIPNMQPVKGFGKKRSIIRHIDDLQAIFKIRFGIELRLQKTYIIDYNDIDLFNTASYENSEW